MSLLERLESLYLGGVRTLFVCLVTIMIVLLPAAGIWLGWSALTLGKHVATDHLDAPEWAELRADILPVPAPTDTSGTGPTADASDTGSGPDPIDPAMASVLSLLDGMYPQDPNWRFSERIGPALLAAWADQALKQSSADRASFLLALQGYAEALATDPLLDRLAADEARLNTLLEALDRFADAYLEAHAAAELQARERNAREEAELASQRSFVLIAGAVIAAAFLTLILLLALLRMERHLAGIRHQESAE